MAYTIDVVYYPRSKDETEAKDVQNSLTKCSLERKARITTSDIYVERRRLGPGGRVIIEADKLDIVKDILRVVMKINSKNFGSCNINIKARKN